MAPLDESWVLYMESHWNHNLKQLYTFVIFSAKRNSATATAGYSLTYRFTWLNYWNELIPTSFLIYNIKKR